MMADLILIHAPSQFDFVARKRLLGPISDVIPSSPVFEMYPVGFVSLASYLERHNFKVKIVNLAYRMLSNPNLDVDKFLANLKPKLAFGIDLHWLPHAHGALELVRRLKRLNPNTPIILGGLSSTYFHKELLARDEVDFVLRGDSTEYPLYLLLRAIKEKGGFESVPNLSWKNGGEIVSNPITNVPANLNECVNDYSYLVLKTGWRFDFFNPTPFYGWWRYPIFAILTCRGCTQNCVICGGSKWSYNFYAKREKIGFQSAEVLASRVAWIIKHFGGPLFFIGDLRQAGMEYAEKLLKALGKLRIKNQVVIELFWAADKKYFELLSKNLENYNIEFSPETHDDEIRKIAGKPYTTDELVKTVDSALSSGVKKLDLFFMAGIPRQTENSVLESVDFFKELYDRFKNDKRLNLFISPLAPFLDPGSIAYENADKYGYKILFKGLDDYVKALSMPSWTMMFNYESETLSRERLVAVAYEAGRRLTALKRERGYLEEGEAKEIFSRIDFSLRIIERLSNERFSNLSWEQIVEVLKREKNFAGDQTICLAREIEWPNLKRKFHVFRLAFSALFRRYG